MKKEHETYAASRRDSLKGTVWKGLAAIGRRLDRIGFGSGDPMAGFAAPAIKRIRIFHRICPAALSALFLATVPAQAEDWSSSEWIAVEGFPKPISETCRKASAVEPGTAVFRKRLELGSDVVSARWTVTALGLFEAYANGKVVGEADLFKPGYDHVFKTRHAFTYEIAPLIGDGGTVELLAIVTAGWWRDAIVSYARRDSAFRAVLTVRWKDGRTKRFCTDSSWEGAVTGPVRRAAIYDGERYDARIGFSGFRPVRQCGEFTGVILSAEEPMMRLREDLAMRPVDAYVWKGVVGAAEDRYGRVVKVRGGWTELAPGETLVIDFGQNATALPRLVATAERGTELTIDPVEMLNESEGRKDRGNDGPEGSAYRDNLRILKDDGAKAVYTFAGGPSERYMPRFSFFGYRYLSLKATGRVTFKSIESVPVSSVPAEAECGRLETGVPALNKFISNVRWGMLSNYMGVPMDCPQRDERLGWAGDAQFFARAAFYQADVYDFFRKWMADMRDCQHDDGSFASVAPYGRTGDDGGRFGFTDAGVVIPYTAWLMSGRRKIVDENWLAMERYLAFVAKDRFAGPVSSLYQWADWLSYEKLGTRNNDAFEVVDGKRRVKPDAAALWRYLGGCYWLYDTQLMIRMAEGTGRTAEAERYRKMEEEALSAVRAEFVGDDGMLPRFMRDMQTPALFALRFGILRDKAAERTRTELLENIRRHGTKLQTGFLGTSILMETLSDFADAPDVAYSLLLQRENPSWLYTVDNGATTVWERWNGFTKEKGFGPAYMNSFNHYSYGSVLSWMYSTMAGIRPDPTAPGFKHFILKPRFDRRLGRVSASYGCRYGEIQSEWVYGEKGGLTWRFSIPNGTSATVVFPNGGWKEFGPGSYSFDL